MRALPAGGVECRPDGALTIRSEGDPMLRSFLLVALVGLVAAPAEAQTAGSGTDQTSWISTTGEAMVGVAPDVAFVQIATEGRARKTVDAQKLSADAMATLLASLKTLALPPTAIATRGYTLQSEFDHVGGEQTFRDYLARNTIEVRVDDLAKLPSVIDTAGTAGAAVVSGLRFDVKDRATLERDLLRRAVDDAMGRAQTIAEGAHRSLGTIVRISEQRNIGATDQRFDAFQGGGAGGGRGGSVPTPVTPGEVQVRAQVSLTVQLR
jgi:uncharacterized protein YggE